MCFLWNSGHFSSHFRTFLVEFCRDRRLRAFCVNSGIFSSHFRTFIVEFCRDRRLRAFPKILKILASSLFSLPCLTIFLTLFEPNSEWHPCLGLGTGLPGTIMEGLHPPIYIWGREAWNPVCHHGRITPLEEDSQSRPGVTDGLSFFLAIVPGQCRGQLLHLVLSHLVPSFSIIKHKFSTLGTQASSKVRPGIVNG